MQVGDLVRCPAIESPSPPAIVQPGYVGLVVGVYGHKVEILGGEKVGIESWDGIPGRHTWDVSDLILLVAA
jgi:hypothetical protein